MRLLFLVGLLALLASSTLHAQRALNAPPAGSGAAPYTVRIIADRTAPQLEVTAPGNDPAAFPLQYTARDGDGDTLLRLADAGQEGTILALLEPVHDAYEAEAKNAGRTGDLTGFINFLAEGADSTAGVQIYATVNPAAADDAGNGNSNWGLAIGALVLGLVLGAVGAGALYRRMKKGRGASGGHNRSATELAALVDTLTEENERLRKGVGGALMPTTSDETSSAQKPTASNRKPSKITPDNTAELTRLHIDLDSLRASEDVLKKTLAETQASLRRAQQESQTFEDRAERYDAFFGALLKHRVAPFYNLVQSGGFNPADPAQRARFAAELLGLGWTAATAARFFAPGHTPSAPERYNMKDLVPLDGEVRAPQPISAADARSGESGLLLAMAEVLRTLGIRSIGDVSIENRRFE